MDNSNSAFSEFNDMSTEELYEFLYRNTDNPDVDALQLDKITAALEVYTARVQEDLAPPCTAEEAVSSVFANISAVFQSSAALPRTHPTMFQLNNTS